MAAAGAGNDPAGTVALVDAALASYAYPRLQWLVRQHVLAALRDFPSLSPAFDTYTGEDGASAVLLNAHGLLAVSPVLPPLRLTAWLPRDYPYHPPIVFVFPAASTPAAALVPGHPFVDHRTGRVRRSLPCLSRWSVPDSTLSDLVGALAAAFRMCHPLTFTFTYNTDTSSPTTSDSERHEEDDDEEVAAMSAVQARLRARAATIDRAVGELEEERIRLERAVTACLGHRDRLFDWLRHADDQIDGVAVTDDAAAAVALEPQAAGGGAPAAGRWLQSKAAELAVDDAMDALAHALENGALAFPEYMKRVKMLAREQFFHCHAGSTAMTKHRCSLAATDQR